MSTSATGPPPSVPNNRQKPPGPPPPTSDSNKTPAESSASASSSQQPHYTHEERLSKSWRNLASSIVGAFQKAEKASAETTKETLKELDESVLVLIRTRMEYHRLLSHVEAKLQGKQQEMESLENYVRTQPRLGKRKRLEVQETAKAPDLEAAAAAVVQVPPSSLATSLPLSTSTSMAMPTTMPTTIPEPLETTSL
jgi:Fic family protein